MGNYNKSLFLFLAFGCLGITTEVFFVALTDFVSALNSGEEINLQLKGHSYPWMFLIYGFGVLGFAKVYPFFESKNILLRLLIFGIGIIIIEFITGFLLDITIGVCPWYYTEGIHVMGYARLDYLPAWMFFGFIMEKVYLFLNKLELSN